ncbi:MAG: hypothetical protein ACK5Q5_23830 [Planctomycetaceae bacterium]
MMQTLKSGEAARIIDDRGGDITESPDVDTRHEGQRGRSFWLRPETPRPIGLVSTSSLAPLSVATILFGLSPLLIIVPVAWNGFATARNRLVLG